MFEPSADFSAVIDGQEAVTVVRPGSSVVSAGVGALRQVVHRPEASQRSGHYAAGDAVWHLPAKALLQPPRPGDVIIDAQGVHWTILDATLALRAGRWRCVTRNLVLAYGLDQGIDLLRGEPVKGSGGAEEMVWHVWRTGLRAKIVPAHADLHTDHAAQCTITRFKVLSVDDLPVDATVRIRGPDGALYAVTGSRKANALDTLVEIDAVRLS